MVVVENNARHRLSETIDHSNRRTWAEVIGVRDVLRHPLGDLLGLVENQPQRGPPGWN